MSRQSGCDIGLVHLYVHLVNAGSFTQVANELSIPVATVSRKIAKLEAQLDTQLIMRSTRRIRLTEEGGALFERYQSVISQLDSLSHPSRRKPEGTLRLATPVSITSMVLMEVLTEFSIAYPDIQLHISQNNQTIDLIDGGVDIAIVGGAQLDSSWVSKLFGVLQYGLYASPEYLDSAATIEHPSQLVEHNLVKVWPLYNWTLTHKVHGEFYYEGPAKLTLSDIHGAVNATKVGAGIMYGPGRFVENELAKGELIQVLPHWRGERRRISLLYHQRSHQPLKVQLFLDFVLSKAPQIFGR
ncbi:LysR substrate-binding domain-containing protein [Shewanella intestini]|uniref:LysR family transcriptional regulator n=1 Tax=Shewanella intestini TaxID=2017544 RepID=A0ABS5HY72_9GAMM|nr:MULTISPECIES: LysR family transcriptional regulator [Shewanella]MBR9726716.1 LysR family transcriptional regulator [Shewanella intestini]MRG34718.1 LysR family transcriptional regulator [Shewanella sp. XMDDZSB0408]